jgi:hypothetical protein
VLGALLALFLLRHWDRGVLDRDEQPMMVRRHVLTLLGALVLSGCSIASQPATVTPATDPAVAALGAGFVSARAPVNGTVRGGTGPAVILLHGFPQDWYEYHQVMPRLAQRFRDLGKSGRPTHSTLWMGGVRSQPDRQYEGYPPPTRWPGSSARAGATSGARW